MRRSVLRNCTLWAIAVLASSALAPRAQAGKFICPPTQITATLDFGTAAAGTTGTAVTLPLPANTVVSLLGSGFSLTFPSSTQVTVTFTPLISMSGTVLASLLYTDVATGCVLIEVPLLGSVTPTVLCSISSAISLTQLGLANGFLSFSGANLILKELMLASVNTGPSSCRCLACALCLAQAEAAAGPPAFVNPSAAALLAALVAQIECLQATCLFPVPPVPPSPKGKF